MNALIRILTFGILYAAVISVDMVPAYAQTERERMALIDSLSRPMVADGSEVMCFETERMEAGEMSEDSEPSEYVFHWRNEGSEPLSITWVQTTCGCASPSYERKSVQPGERSSLKITYNPKGHPGGFLRRIFVYTNLSDKTPTAVLELAGKVIPSVLPTGDYPVAMGPLLLKRDVVRFVGDGRQTERIECLNAGDKPLEISVDPRILPQGVSVETLTVASGEIADLVLRFDPSKASKLPESVPVFLKGLGLAPTKSMITIIFK